MDAGAVAATVFVVLAAEIIQKKEDWIHAGQREEEEREFCWREVREKRLRLHTIHGHSNANWLASACLPAARSSNPAGQQSKQRRQPTGSPVHAEIKAAQDTLIAATRLQSASQRASLLGR